MTSGVTSMKPLLVARGVSKRFGAEETSVDVDFDVDDGPRTQVGTLSGGRRQAVAIARSLVTHPRILILDEPSAALGVVQTAQVLTLIEHLREQGLAIVVISHNLDNVFHVADRISVLRHGRRVATFDRRRAAREDVVAAITGADRRKAAA